MKTKFKKTTETEIDVDRICRAVAWAEFGFNGGVHKPSEPKPSYFRELVLNVIKVPTNAIRIAYYDDQKFWKQTNTHPQQIMPFEEWVKTELGLLGAMQVNIILALAYGAVPDMSTVENLEVLELIEQ